MNDADLNAIVFVDGNADVPVTRQRITMTDPHPTARPVTLRIDNLPVGA